MMDAMVENQSGFQSKPLGTYFIKPGLTLQSWDKIEMEAEMKPICRNAKIAYHYILEIN